MLRFIHAADIHLDSPLRGLSDYPNAPVGRLRSATRLAFSELVSRAIDEHVDFLVIAGDLYDGDWRDHNTGIFFCQEMGRLKRAGIRCFVLFGNHDAASEMTKKLELPDNVLCFDAKKPQVVTLSELNVALHGQSFKDKETTDNLATNYPAPRAGCFNIGVLHTALEGHASHASYAPCTVDELHARGYQYWALGHVHDFKQWSGPSTIVFPGNLQGRHVRELGRKGAVLVTVNEGQCEVERLYIDILRWESVEVDASRCHSLAEVSRRVGLSLEDVLNTDGHVPRAVRVTVTGRTPAHGELWGLEHQLRQEVLGHIAALGDDKLWLEKVKLQTQAPDRGAAALHEDALTDLAAILAEAQVDPAFLEELKEELAPFVGKAQIDLFKLVPDLDRIRAGQLSQLVEEVAPGLLGHLAREV